MTATTQQSKKTTHIFKAIFFCIVFTGLFVVLSFAKGFIPNNYERIAHGVIGTAAAFLTTYLFLKLDRLSWSAVGLSLEPKTLTRFITGVLFGVAIMGLMSITLIYFTHKRIFINPNGNLFHFFLITATLIPLAFMEELGFRAYPLEILRNKVGVRLSIIITSVLFALYHLVNGWTIASSFMGAGVWGLVFGLAAIYSKGIAMPTGMHYAVNLTTSAFGAANNTVSLWILKEPTGPAFTTNDRYDLQMIIPSLALFVFAITCFWLLKKRKQVNTAK